MKRKKRFLLKCRQHFRGFSVHFQPNCSFIPVNGSFLCPTRNDLNSWLCEDRLQVLVQPADVVVQAPLSNAGHHGQEREDHAAVETVLVVVACCRDAGLLQPPDVHQAVVPQHIKLTGHDVGGGRASQNRLLGQQRGRPRVQELWQDVRRPRRPPGSDHGLEVLPSLRGQQGAPVHLGPGLGQLLQGAVVVGEQQRLQRGAGAQVLQPETGHEGPGEDGRGRVLLVGRRVEVQRLQHRINQGLDLELRSQALIRAELWTQRGFSLCVCVCVRACVCVLPPGPRQQPGCPRSCPRTRTLFLDQFCSVLKRRGTGRPATPPAHHSIDLGTPPLEPACNYGNRKQLSRQRQLTSKLLLIRKIVCCFNASTYSTDITTESSSSAIFRHRRSYERIPGSTSRVVPGHLLF